MKNIILDGQTYNGISEVSLPISDGTALFKDKDEIIEPTGSLNITANGTYNIANYENVIVNVGGVIPTLESISAVFTQGETVVYPSTALDDLKSMLVVTAHYSDSSTTAVSDYELSGVLTEGTSTVTVTYNGKTTTFTVSVSAEVEFPDYVEFLTITPPNNTQSLTFNTQQAKVALVDVRCEDVTSDASDNVGRVYNYLYATQPTYINSSTVQGTVGYYKNDGTGDKDTYSWQYEPFSKNGNSVTIKSDRGPIFEGGKTYYITIIGDKVEEVSL